MQKEIQKLRERESGTVKEGCKHKCLSTSPFSEVTLITSPRPSQPATHLYRRLQVAGGLLDERQGRRHPHSHASGTKISKHSQDVMDCHPPSLKPLGTSRRRLPASLVITSRVFSLLIGCLASTVVYQ